MPEPTWIQVSTVSIKARPGDSPWQRALAYVEGPVFLKIEAEGLWRYSSPFGRWCSANGDLLSLLSSKTCIHDKSPVGALIGRIGGSIADKDSSSVFAVGSFWVRKLEQGSGALFLTINDLWTGFDDNEGELSVRIYFSAPSQ